MVNGLMDAVKGVSGSKTSQTQKSKKVSSNEKADFGQALTDAAGAANSANAQPQRQTSDQKDVLAAEKATENVQAVSENQGPQMSAGQETAEGQDVLASLMRMGTEGIRTAEGAERVWGQNITVPEQETDVVLLESQGNDAVEQVLASGAVKDLPQEAMAEAEMSVGAEELIGKASMEHPAEQKVQQTASDDAGKYAAVKPVEEENSIVDVKAEAAADKAGMSYMQFQGSSDSGVVKAEVEVTPTGEIKPEYANMLKDMIAKQISSGRQEFEISLTPRNLGALLVKVAVEAGETTVSIVCSNAKVMEAMSSKASELGKMLETTLGDKMEVVVEDKNSQDSRFYEDGRDGSGAQAQKEEQERRHEENRRKMEQEAGSVDFLQQLRLGLA